MRIFSKQFVLVYVSSAFILRKSLSPTCRDGLEFLLRDCHSEIRSSRRVCKISLDFSDLSDLNLHPTHRDLRVGFAAGCGFVCVVFVIVVVVVVGVVLAP